MHDRSCSHALAPMLSTPASSGVSHATSAEQHCVSRHWSQVAFPVSAPTAQVAASAAASLPASATAQQ